MDRRSEHVGMTVLQGRYIEGGFIITSSSALGLSLYKTLLGEGAPDDKCWSKAALKNRFYG